MNQDFDLIVKGYRMVAEGYIQAYKQDKTELDEVFDDFFSRFIKFSRNKTYLKKVFVINKFLFDEVVGVERYMEVYFKEIRPFVKAK